MNGSIIRYILGYVLKLEAVLMLFPCITAVCYGEKEGFSYLAVAVFTFLLGFFMSLKKPGSSVFYLKDGCVATALSWIFLSIFGAIPFLLTREIPAVEDALFETVSGFTTTGASILGDVEALSHASLLWRSLTHWIGGMGVLVFLLAIIPLSGGSNINLMRAESPGPSVGKLYPKVKNTARILYMIYFGMTILQFILLLAGHMPLFDAVCTSFGTAGTGGFGIKNDSFGSYSPYLQWVTAIFMILFAVNFNAYYYILYRKFKQAFQMEEVRYYFIIVFAATAFITVNILPQTGSVFEALTQSIFQVGSLVSSTGFSSTNYDTWPYARKTVLV
ncbi:MAG: TrkH family potassium uptake protein, partial [Lachnospiraceae bacterium]|nr:TrkH family potassium uptake protein [Lachnospiraceae bacterium]